MTKKLKIVGPYTTEHKGPFCTRNKRPVEIVLRQGRGGKIWGYMGDDTQQFIVTPAHSGVTVEEAQAEALRWVRDEMEGRCVVTDHFPDPVKKRTLDEFLQENME